MKSKFKTTMKNLVIKKMSSGDLAAEMLEARANANNGSIFSRRNLLIGAAVVVVGVLVYRKMSAKKTVVKPTAAPSSNGAPSDPRDQMGECGSCTSEGCQVGSCGASN